MATQCAVRAITGFCGIQPTSNEIFLHIDQKTVTFGSVISGTIQVVGEYAHEVTTDVVLEGIEYTVVALPQQQLDEYGNVGLEYLRKHTAQSQTFLRNHMTIHEAENLSAFRFKLPDDIPGTLRCTLDGTNRLLPSQCQVRYTVTATIMNQGTSPKQHVSYPVIVRPRRDCDVPLDPGLQVSATGSAMDVFYRNLIFCGAESDVLPSCSTSTCSHPAVPDAIQISHSCSSDDDILELDDDEDDDDDEINEFAHIMKSLTMKPHLLLESSHAKLNLSAGQTFEVTVKDWFRQLKPGNWMIRFTEELSWKAQGRKAKSHQTWDLYANTHELPTTLRRSFVGSLVSVRHELIVYLTSADSSKEILALTEPIPVLIVSNHRGWDA